MIYTVTFNPALDYVVHLKRCRMGEVNRSDAEEIQFGGKGINVSVVLHRLGVENTALGFLAGFTGKALEEELRRSGICADFIWLAEGLTRINVKIRAQEETEINGCGPRIDELALATLLSRLDRLQSGDILVLSGSVPPSMPGDIYRRILAGLEGQGVRFVVDASRDLLTETLAYHPFLIKPNRTELEEICGRRLHSDRELWDAAAELQCRGAGNVLVSMAGEGSLLLDETGSCHRLAAPRGVVRNSVGAGDSMVAGFLAGYLERGDYLYAHRLGVAAGSATAFCDGLATGEEIRALLAEISV